MKACIKVDSSRNIFYDNTLFQSRLILNHNFEKASCGFAKLLYNSNALFLCECICVLYEHWMANWSKISVQILK